MTELEALIAATNPETHSDELSAIYKVNKHNLVICGAIAANPNTPIDLLVELTDKYAEFVASNPVLPLLLVEDPLVFCRFGYRIEYFLKTPEIANKYGSIIINQLLRGYYENTVDFKCVNNILSMIWSNPWLSDYWNQIFQRPTDLKPWINSHTFDQPIVFYGVIFKEILFSNIAFERVYFRDCIFENCTFVNVSFKECNFRSTNFVRINLNRLNEKAPIYFILCDLKGVIFKNSNFYTAIYKSCDLNTAKWLECNLTKVEFNLCCAPNSLAIKNCDLSGTFFDHSQFVIKKENFTGNYIKTFPPKYNYSEPHFLNALIKGYFPDHDPII